MDKSRWNILRLHCRNHESWGGGLAARIRVPDGTPLASSPLGLFELQGSKAMLGHPAIRQASKLPGPSESLQVLVGVGIQQLGDPVLIQSFGVHRVLPAIAQGNVFLLEFGYDSNTATGRRAAASTPAPQAKP